MLITQLIRELSHALEWTGNREVELEIHRHDGNFAYGERTGSLSFVAEKTFGNKPLRLVARQFDEGEK